MDTTTLGLAEAAQTLRLSWWGARQLLLRGDLKGALIDGRWRVERASLAAYQDAQQHVAA